MLQLIAHLFERGVLLDNLVAESALLDAEIGEAVLDGHEVDWRSRRRRLLLRGHDIGDRSGDVAIEEGKDPLDERQGRP